MASAIITNESNNKNEGKMFTISQSEVLRTLCGVRTSDGEIHTPKKAIKPSKWVLHDDLRFVGQKADNDSTYYGLVPVIGGVERPDLAIMRDSCRLTAVEHYTTDKDGNLSEEGQIIPVEDKLRTAVQIANDKTLKEGGTWFEWWEHLANEIKGCSIGCLTYKGRRYDNQKPYDGVELILL